MGIFLTPRTQDVSCIMAKLAHFDEMIMMLICIFVLHQH